MNVIEIMVTIIIVTILVTVVLGAASYAAYWLRRARRPEPQSHERDGPRYFYRYVPEPGLAARWNGDGTRTDEAPEDQPEESIEESATVEKPADLVHAGSSSGS